MKIDKATIALMSHFIITSKKYHQSYLESTF